MNRGVADVYHVFQNIDTGELHYIFKKNILRFRVCKTYSDADPEWMKDKVFLQFVMRDGDKVGFFMTKSSNDSWREKLPNPDKAHIMDIKFSVEATERRS